MERQNVLPNNGNASAKDESSGRRREEGLYEKKKKRKSEPLGPYINKCTNMENGFLQRNKVISLVIRTGFIIYFFALSVTLGTQRVL